MNRIRGLDSIRFVCAVWVMLSHFGVPVPFGHNAPTLLLRMIDSTLHSMVYGVAAVIVFFVISGFCIHYPFRHGEQHAWGEYFLRRYIRIGLPFLAATAFVHFTDGQLGALQNAVLWSLYAEMIYYGIYPLLMFVRRRLGWTALFTLAYLGTAAVVLAQPNVVFFSAHGTALTWLMGLPCWLLGVRLAEEADTLTDRRARVPIGVWRLAVWGVSSLLLVMEFHSPTGSYTSLSGSKTLPFFSLLVFFWLRQEIGYYRTRAPLPWLENAGAWSYSLYLMHHPAEWLAGLLTIPGDPAVIIWSLKVVLALVLSYVFYRLVERPSHWLARQVKQKRLPEVKPPQTEISPKEAVLETAQRPASVDVG